MKNQNIFLASLLLFFGTAFSMNKETESTPGATLEPWEYEPWSPVVRLKEGNKKEHNKLLIELLNKNNELLQESNKLKRQKHQLLEQTNALKQQELDMKWIELALFKSSKTGYDSKFKLNEINELLYYNTERITKPVTKVMNREAKNSTIL